MSRSLAPVLFVALVAAGILVGFAGPSTAQGPAGPSEVAGPPEVFVFFDEEGEADFYAAESRRESFNQTLVITFLTVGVLGLAVVIGDRVGELTADSV